MYVDSLDFQINWKEKTIMIQDKGTEGEYEYVKIDEYGQFTLKHDIFRERIVGQLVSFVHDLTELVNDNQRQAIYQYFGNANAITISNMALIVEDRMLAKGILMLGLKKGVITAGFNSTYKIIRKEEKQTMKEWAVTMLRKPREEPKTIKEEIEETERYMQMGQDRADRKYGKDQVEVVKEESSDEEPNTTVEDMKQIHGLEKPIKMIIPNETENPIKPVGAKAIVKVKEVEKVMGSMIDYSKEITKMEKELVMVKAAIVKNDKNDDIHAKITRRGDLMMAIQKLKNKEQAQRISMKKGVILMSDAKRLSEMKKK
jgi:hypothetical protein